MSLPRSATVLIVGAGPSGLTAGLSLLHHGVRDIAIVDAILQGDNSSRAAVIHAATIETLDKISAASSLVARGLKIEDVYLRTRTWDLVHASFSLLKGLTTHPYSLLLPQNITENILTERLRDMGVNVHRPYKVVGMRQNAADRWMTDVLFEGGQVISAKYVIGADGARSTVRTAAGIDFRDPEGTSDEHRLTQMILADVTFTREPDMKGLFNGVMSADSWFILMNWRERFNKELAAPGEPVRGSLYRIGCGIPVSHGTPPPSPSKEYIQKALNTFGPEFLSSDPKLSHETIEVDRVLWSTRFRTHSAIAGRTFTRLQSETPGEGGVILLIGDAAHIHPPAGGQGMNLGLRDAVFLGEALSKHLDASTSSPNNQGEIDAVLQEYAEIRRERALGIIQFTRSYLQFVSMPYSSHWWMPLSLGWIRDLFVRLCGQFTFLQSKVAWGVSGLGRI